MQCRTATPGPAPVLDAAAQALRVLLASQVPQVPQVPAAEPGRLFARMTRVRAVPTG
jgi:hypothetical protein